MKIKFRWPMVGGRGQCCTNTLLHMNRLNKTESAIFVSLMCSLFPEDLIQNLFNMVLCISLVQAQDPLWNHLNRIRKGTPGNA